MAQRIHMVGIGGIGMSALAQLFVAQGARLSGSDRDESPTMAMLRAKGIDVHIGQDAAHVPDDVELLVYSDAVPEDNSERVRARALGAKEQNYFEALGVAALGKRVVAIAGTHGKTTTTAMLSKILIDAGKDPTAVVGSIVSEWGSNYREGTSDLFVVEACEYRNHFFAFRPEVLVITNIELDHTDFFKTVPELEAAFDEARSHAKIVIEQAQYKDEVVPPLLVPGEFNKDNARAAKAAAKTIAPDITDAQIDASLAAFKGTWRRFEHKGMLPGGAELYDDYAHHPTAITKTVQAAREQFPGKKIVLFFHPHLYSRTRDLFDDFALALAQADMVYILPIYAAREPYDPTVASDRLAEAVNARGGHAQAIPTMQEAAILLRACGPDSVAFTMGAGDVYKAGEAALARQ